MYAAADGIQIHVLALIPKRASRFGGRVSSCGAQRRRWAASGSLAGLIVDATVFPCPRADAVSVASAALVSERTSTARELEKKTKRKKNISN